MPHPNTQEVSSFSHCSGYVRLHFHDQLLYNATRLLRRLNFLSLNSVSSLAILKDSSLYSHPNLCCRSGRLATLPQNLVFISTICRGYSWTWLPVRGCPARRST